MSKIERINETQKLVYDLLAELMMVELADDLAADDDDLAKGTVDESLPS